MTGNFTVYFAFLSFFVYGFLGWCTEVAFAAFKERRFVNRGFLNGPICPIYGVGVTMVIWCLDPVRENLLILYVASVILVTVLEGLTGYAMDKIFHNKWWDYSNMPMNIGGYVCVLFSLIWGVACGNRGCNPSDHFQRTGMDSVYCGRGIDRDPDVYAVCRPLCNGIGYH